ncbi:DeoR/GlpR transcriptional regulator [Pseudomonas syringae]|uniref:DeoR/GlpR family DNA-binding transcription regulator n=1 Tax=Pseudomonas syringae TaxID=317 RepID=UPI001917A002|nr:DeoR/GlpR family DNA-binding transcription regulator [Pseudomonas syringae]QQQ51878.1 DeoR/GlpR transcriptional regulator [Pseudomonas syringae]
MHHVPLLSQERHSLILEKIESEGRVLAPQLALQMRVSEDTIRRDLRDLAAAGLCRKVYGGAVRLPSSPTPGTIVERENFQAAAKSLLAVAAVSFVSAGDVLFIDSGTSNLSIAKALPDIALTVVTNAPMVAAALLNHRNIELIMLGGRVDMRSGSALGAATLREAEMLRPDLYILGACGVDAEAGVSAFNYDEAQFKRNVARLSKAILIVATADKLATAGPYLIWPTNQVTHLVIPEDVDPLYDTAFTAHGVNVVRAAVSI